MMRILLSERTEHRRLQLFVHRALIFLVLVFAALAPSLSLAGPDGLVRIQKKDEAEVYQGQKVSFYVQLLSSGLFSGSPRFDLPEMIEGLLFQVPGSSIQGTETVDGTSYASQLYELWFFPKQSGPITISAITANFTTSDFLKKNRQPHQLATEPFVVQVKPIPGADPGGGTIVVTNNFKAVQSWDPAPADGMVGTAYTRVIRMEGKDTASIFLPEIQYPAMDGVAVYPKPPELNDANQRGEATGYRIEAVTYLFEHEGHYSLPAVHLAWFNLGRGQLEEIVLDGAVFTITPDPNKPQGTLAQAAEQQDRMFVIAALVLLALALLAFFLRRPVIEGLTRWHNQRRAQYLQSEKANFKKVIEACKAGAPLPVYNALYFWLRKRFGNDALTLVPFLGEKGDKSLADDLSSLDTELFSPGNIRTGSWQGASLLRRIIHFRKSTHRLEKTQSQHTPFSRLNQ